MIKKIASHALRPGMYVCDLGCRWTDHPFALNRFTVREEDIGEILEAGIAEVSIDTERGEDVTAPASAPPPRATAETLVALASVPSRPPRVGLEKEIARAKQVHAASCRVVREVLRDARLGRQVSIERATGVVESIAQSILSNPGPLLALGRIRKKDEYTFMHSVSVCTLLMVVASSAGLGEEAVRDAGLGALLHDIGKTAIPDEVLNKPGKFTDSERTLMRSHVVKGADMLAGRPGVSAAALDVVAQHHERYDGSGYPHKLREAEISPLGQMAAVVDVYDALTSDRIYHKRLSPPAAVGKIFEGAGSQFNPEIVQALIRSVGIYPTASLVMLESGRLALVIEQSDGTLLQPKVRVVYDTREAEFVKPYDVDLAHHGAGDRIVQHESPEKWGIEPFLYLA